ncbi:MAG TPA: Ig-like domain-containing protein, partial [Verrucomicrobiales bacterium]|nr:Ig-like domain-containing protein [Verrucomicrobiales bacterium]
RFNLKPGTGSHNPAEGNPGVFYIGDVGYDKWEDLQVCDGSAQNFGWPLYEGFSQRDGYWSKRPAGMDAADQKLPALDWNHGNGTAHVLKGGTVYNVGAAGTPVPGSNFSGNAATGSVWYTGGDFPAEWQNIYFQADFGGQWIRALTMDGNDEVAQIRSFATGEPFVYLTTHPETGGIYYCSVADGSKAGRVRRISWAPGGNRPPVAVASVDRQYGSSPLTVQFSSALSSDPENAAMTYSWNFGDGTSSTLANPAKTYTATGPQRFDAVLTVRDSGGATASSAIVITVNNTPPVVQITTPAPGAQYPLNQGYLTYTLAAAVTDAEQPTAALTHQWQIDLVHDNHEHVELVVDAATATVALEPVGNDPNATYYYRLILRVTDPLGLTTVSERFFMPQTGTSAIVMTPDFFTLSKGSAEMFDVLINDHGAITDADFSTLQIVSAPASGTAVPDPVTGLIRYQHNGSSAVTDSFTYRLKTKAGVLSATGTASITITPAVSNNPPIASSDSVSVSRGQSVNIPLIANDSDPGGAINPASVAIVSRPVSGVLSLNPQTGAVIYTHNNSALTADSFTYSVADSQGLRSEPAVVKISITAQTGAPVLTNPGGQTSSRGAVITLPLTATDPQGRALTWSASGLPQGLSINAGTGLISGTIGAAATGTTVTVNVSNGTQTTSSAFSWAINLPPPANGLLAEYFDGITPGVNPPLLTRNDAAINFDWGIGSPAPSVPVDNFSARWTGELVPLYTEPYSFHVSADNGVRVWIDNVLVLDKWLPAGTGG